METAREIVITGVGVVSPIGIGNDQFWASLVEARSGVKRLSLTGADRLPCPIGGEVLDFQPGQYIRPRKNLKVMSREIQMGCAAAALACAHAGLDETPADPDRLGVVFGADLMPCELPEIAPSFRVCITDGRFDFSLWGQRALAELYPLWMLKYLPNMPACHIAISRDARGPNNSAVLAEASSLSAIAEACRVIGRGQADVMIAGGTGSRLHPTAFARHNLYRLSERRDDPAAACRPFDADRDGSVHGEGAAAFILEERRAAEARGAPIIATIRGACASFEPPRKGQPATGDAIRRAIRGALHDARLTAAEIGHVNAEGRGSKEDDPIEAQAIRGTVGDVPVIAAKSYFGNLAAGTGAVEMAVSVLALHHGIVPPTLNYQRPDPACPVNVLHGQSTKAVLKSALVLNQTPTGQAIASVITAD